MPVFRGNRASVQGSVQGEMSQCSGGNEPVFGGK